MKFSFLLAHQQFLQQQARLAHLAFCFQRLSDFDARAMRAQLQGTVRLQQAAPELERYVPTLTALAGSQSVIEEFFTDEDLIDFCDGVTAVTGNPEVDVSFDLREIDVCFVMPLRERLRDAGVSFDLPQSLNGPQAAKPDPNGCWADDRED